MKIKKNSLKSLTRTKKGTHIKESDHNTLISQFTFKYNTHIKKHKIEISNFKDIKGQEKFKTLTENNDKLSSVLKNTKYLNEATHIFMKTLNRIFHQSFWKIRIKEIQNKDIMNLFQRRRILRSKSDEESKKQLRKVEEKLADKCAHENFIKIKEGTKDIECNEGGFNAGKFWKLKKKLLPRPPDPPTAMLDQAGNLITSVVGVEKLLVEHYKRV